MKINLPNRKVGIIFCGLMRKPELLKRSVQDMVGFRKKGLIDKIVYSTWDYEVEKNPEIVAFLKKNGVFVIGSEEPRNRGIGNVFCQMKSLEIGLAHVSKNSFVLKTRSDLYINSNLLENLLRNKEKLLRITHDLPKGNIFLYKVWSPYFEITNPFHLGDECFFGFHKDVCLLVNFIDYYKNLNLSGGVVHIQRYIHPFIRDYPKIETFFRENSDVGFPKDESLLYRVMRKVSRKNKFFSNILNSITVNNRFSVLRKKLNDNLYLETLAVYYSILHSHFYIDNSYVDNEMNNAEIWKRNFKPQKQVGDPEIMNNFSKERISTKSKGQIYSFDEKFLKNLFENRKKQKDPVGDNLLSAIDKFNLS